MVTFLNFNLFQFIFSYLFIFFHPYVCSFSFLFFFPFVFSPPHTYPHFSSLSSFLLFIFYLLVYLYLQMSLFFTWTKNTKTYHSSSYYIEGKSPLCSTKGDKNSLRPLSSISIHIVGQIFFYFLFFKLLWFYQFYEKECVLRLDCVLYFVHIVFWCLCSS